MWIVIADDRGPTITVRADDVRMVTRPRYGQCFVTLVTGQVIEVEDGEADRISSLLVNGAKGPEPAEVTA